MKTRKTFPFGLVALSLAMTATPAAALRRESEDRFRSGYREEQVEREHRDRDYHRRAHERREYRYRLAYRAPYFAPSCYRQPGYWAWDGWQRVWVRSLTACR